MRKNHKNQYPKTGRPSLFRKFKRERQGLLYTRQRSLDLYCKAPKKLCRLSRSPHAWSLCSKIMSSAAQSMCFGRNTHFSNRLKLAGVYQSLILRRTSLKELLRRFSVTGKVVQSGHKTKSMTTNASKARSSGSVWFCLESLYEPKALACSANICSAETPPLPSASLWNPSSEGPRFLNDQTTPVEARNVMVGLPCPRPNNCVQV